MGSLLGWFGYTGWFGRGEESERGDFASVRCEVCEFKLQTKEVHIGFV